MLSSEGFWLSASIAFWSARMSCSWASISCGTESDWTAADCSGAGVAAASGAVGASGCVAGSETVMALILDRIRLLAPLPCAISPGLFNAVTDQYSASLALSHCA